MTIDADVRDQFAGLGVAIPEDEIEDDEGDEEVAVWDVNWKALEAFLAASTQWRELAGLGGSVWRGLDYSGLPVILDRFAAPLVGNRRTIARSRTVRDRLFDDLQVMEFAALEAYGEASE